MGTWRGDKRFSIFGYSECPFGITAKGIAYQRYWCQRYCLPKGIACPKVLHGQEIAPIPISCAVDKFETRARPWARYSRDFVHQRCSCVHTLTHTTSRSMNRARRGGKAPRRTHRTPDSVRGRAAFVGLGGWVWGGSK